MKIGIIGTIWLNTPPRGYGGTEQVIYNLTNTLVDMGHDVTFFGPATAHVKAKIIPTIDNPLREMNISWENIPYPLMHLTKVFESEEHFDILHMHLNKNQDYVALPFALYRNIPTLFTIHFRVPDSLYKSDRHLFLRKYRELPFTSISNSQQKPEQLHFLKTIYNSINLEDYPFNPTPQDYFVWLGKILPIKGTKEAIIAAKKAGVRLILMGAVESGVPEAVRYFEEEIIPLIDGEQIILKENVMLPEKAEILGGAKALLNPIEWDEPFGLVMIESQATGTPVIAFERGAASEVVQDGRTGFLVHTIDEMVTKIHQYDRINRQDCRNFIAQTFTNENMANGYLETYQTVRDNWDTYVKKQWEILREK